MIDFNTISQITFSIAILITGILTYKCLTPPTTPTFDDNKIKKDTVGFRGNFVLLALTRHVMVIFTICQAILCMFDDDDDDNYSPSKYHHHHHPIIVNKTLITWNIYSVVFFLVHWTSSLLRIHAMSKLGADFTFELHVPQKLNTSGIYRFVQHPSYTGMMVVMGTWVLWFTRLDGPVMVRVMPSFVLDAPWTWYVLGVVVSVVISSVGLGYRVREEEEMLRARFGVEWEVWHASTARFVPLMF